MDAAKISLQRGTIVLTAEGSETFVREAIELWDKVSEGVERQPDQLHSGEVPTEKHEHEVAAREHGSASLRRYDHVFDSVNDQLKIIANIPGKSKAEQTRNVALLTLYGQFLQGNEHVQSEQIRAACVDQGCYDSTNFAGYLKSLKSSVVMNTKAGGQYDIKLTAPGRKAAKELCDQLQLGD